MRVNDAKRSRFLRYVCRSTPHEGTASFCQSFGAIHLERGAAGAFVVRALQQLNPMPFKCIAAEAEPQHFRWMLEHFTPRPSRTARCVGWQCVNDNACSSVAATPYGEISFQDGMQSWVNPAGRVTATG